MTRLATQIAKTEELKAIEDILQNYDMSSDYIKKVALNCEFHRKIGSACGNPIYSIIINTIMDYNERFSITLNPFRIVIHRQGDHRKIFNAIKDRNPEKAIILSQEHCQHLLEDMKKYEKTYLALVNK